MAVAESFPASDSEEARCSAAGRGQWMLRAMRTSVSSQTHPRVPLSAADRSVPSLTERARQRWPPAATDSAGVVPVAQLCPSLASSLGGLPE